MKQIRILVLLLLVAGFLRSQHLVEFVEWPDEIWSVWHVQGTFEEAMSRVPADWPPLFSAITWGWQQVVGYSLEAARYLSVLFSLLTLVFVYRAALLLLGGTGEQRERGAVIAASTYTVMAYGIFAGVDVRAYGMLLALGALALWMMLRWLRRPTWQRGLLVAVTLAGLFYTSYTSAIFIAFVSGVVVLLRPRLIVRWIGVGLTSVVLMLPILPSFWANAEQRLEVMVIPKPPILQSMADIFRDFGGSYVFVGVLAACVVTEVVVCLRQARERRVGLILGVWLIVPAMMYVLAESNEFMKPRYMWWVLLGTALVVGYAGRALPRLLYPFAIVGLLALPLSPVDWDQYRMAVTTSPPFRDSFKWLADHLRPGDVMVIDPQCTCGEPTGWDYFLPQYFPAGHLPIVDEPGGAARVWYVSNNGWGHDEDLLAEIENGRKASIFVGPWFFLTRLYEGPPSWEGTRFGEAMRLNGVELPPNLSALHENQTIPVKLWWSVDERVEVDYSISVAVIDSYGQIVAQADGPAQATDTPNQTSAWEAGRYYEDFRTLKLPNPLPGGEYRFVVSVYQWWDGVRLQPAADGAVEGDNLDGYLVIEQLRAVTY